MTPGISSPTAERLRLIARLASVAAFPYMVALMGITEAQQQAAGPPAAPLHTAADMPLLAALTGIAFAGVPLGLLLGLVRELEALAGAFVLACLAVLTVGMLVEESWTPLDGLEYLVLAVPPLLLIATWLLWDRAHPVRKPPGGPDARTFAPRN